MKKLLTLGLLFFVLPAHSQQWISLQDNNSRIEFTARYDAVAFKGKFTAFTSQFSGDANNVANSTLHTRIDVTSVDTRSRDRDDALAQMDWFYFSKFPQAVFTSQSITRIDDNTLEVSGLLTIRDQQHAVTFPMQWMAIKNGQRRAEGRLQLDRRDYHIGGGEWLQDDTIGFDVDVIFSITYALAND